MSSPREFHENAMHELDRAEVAIARGSSEEGDVHLREAYRLEVQAADLLADLDAPEPTRAILHRSAATLAYRCDDLPNAERLIHRGLSASPPDFLAEELRDLLEQVTFRRHLELRGVEIDDNELQMSLAGAGVGLGFAPTDGLLDRLNSFAAMLFRTAERTLDIPYRESGAHLARVHQLVDSYISVPRPASFAITVRLGKSEQLSFSGIGRTEQIVDEVLNCLDLFESGNDSALRLRIEDDSYFNNFLGLARNLAPDGKIIQTVGFTTIRSGRQRQMALRRTRADNLQDGLALMTPKEYVPSKRKNIETIETKGVLQYANSLRGKHQLKLMADHEPIAIEVPNGMLDDIVRPLWGREVIVRGFRKGRKIVLEDVRPYLG